MKRSSLLVSLKRLSLLGLVSLTLIGCQTHLAAHVRDNVFPEDTTTKLLMSPLLLPAYLGLTIVDITFVNPFRGAEHVPGISRTMWEFQEEPAWVGYGALLPFKLVGIPITAVGTVLFSEQFGSTHPEDK